MAFDAFISYSVADKAVADAACATLESAGIRCWIAPRDVPPGSQWASAIVSGIDGCSVMVLIFSSKANLSHQVHREVERAVSKGVPIIPLRIEDVTPTSSMEYFLGSIHWLDALTPPLESHLARLAETVRSCVGSAQDSKDAPPRSDPVRVTTPAPVTVAASQAVPVQSRRRWAAFAALLALIFVAGGAAYSYFKSAPGAQVPPPAPTAKQQVAAAPAGQQPAVVVAPVTPGPCGDGVVAVSLASRCATPLTAAEERALKAKDGFKECDQCPEMVVVPVGTFTIGSPPNELGRYNNEGPSREVTLKKPFAIGKFTLTVDQFTAFVAETGHEPASGCYTLGGGKIVMGSGLNWRAPGFAQRGTQPAVCVNWGDAKLYVVWLSGKTGKAYRLPTEAEWEYAARAGSTTRYFFGEREADLCRYGNGADLTAKSNLDGTQTWPVAPCSDGYVFTAPVGSFSPNGFGLYDMLGNTLQWTEDCYHDSYLGAPSDGSNWLGGDCNLRVLRGGGWASLPRDVRSAWRFGVNPGDHGDAVSFRVVRALTP